MNTNQKRVRRFANKNNGACPNSTRQLATQHVKRVAGQRAKVAFKPVIDKGFIHWRMSDQIKFCNAPNRAAAQAVYDSVK